MIKGKYTTKEEIPVGLEEHYVESNGEWIVEGDADAALVLNPAALRTNQALKGEKLALQTKYDALKESAGTGQDVDTLVNLRVELAEAKRNAISNTDKAILEAVKAVDPAIKPTTVKERLTQFPTINEELTQIKAEKENDAFFEATKYKNRTMFNKAMRDKDVNPNLVGVGVDVVQEGENKISKPYARVKNPTSGEIEKVDWSVYVGQQKGWEDYMPAIVGASNENTGQSYVATTNSGVGNTGNVNTGGIKMNPVLKAAIDKNNAKATTVPNPLYPNVPQPKTAETTAQK